MTDRTAGTPGPALALPWLARFEVDVGPVRSLGVMAGGERRVVPITGGRAIGAPAGSIEAGGADWQWVRTDGITEIEAHYMVRTDAGETVEVTSRGYRHGPADVLARLAAGEGVDPALYYFRTAVTFRTAAAAFARLNGLIALAVGERRPGAVRLEIYELR